MIISKSYRLIAVDLNRQKELDADPKAIQQIKFVEQLKKLKADNTNVESMFILMVLEKIKKRKKETKIFSRNTQLNKLKSAAKNKTGTILRINKKNFEDEELPHELFLTIRQTSKVRNAFANNMSTDIKLSNAQIFKIIQSGGSFGSWLGNLGKRALTNIAIPLARDILAGLVSNLTSNAIGKFERKTSGKGTVRGGKVFTLFILNGNMSDIIKITKSLEDSVVLIDGVPETVKREI